MLADINDITRAHKTWLKQYRRYNSIREAIARYKRHFGELKMNFMARIFVNMFSIIILHFDNSWSP